MKRNKRNQRHSIRYRIMAIFIGLMAVMLFAIWVVNNWWLEPYYLNQRLGVMEDAYTNINAVIMEKVNAGENIGDLIQKEAAREWALWGEASRKDDEPGNDAADDDAEKPDDSGNLPKPRRRSDQTPDPEQDNTLLGAIRSYGEKNNITTVLIDSNTGSALLSSGRESDFLAQKVQRYVLGKGENRATTMKKHKNYVVETNYDFRTNSIYMESWGFFSDNSTLFIMSMPLASIRDSVALSNRFTTYVGLIALVLGGVLMYFATNRVTKPLMKLADVSKEMSNLNFDVAYEDDAQDEIGDLGRSMNVLSTTLKDTIGALQEANRQLQHDIEEKIQIDEMRKEFIANVSHELKTPIALIQGYAEGLTEGMCEDEESRDYYCEVIMDEANKMNKMVKQLLTLTALEFGNDTPVLETFDVAELIRELVNSASILMQQKEANVKLEVPEELFVTGDEFKIEEVVTNYLTNAMNHLDGERRIQIWADQRENKVTVHIFNTGSPIPEEDLPNLWTKFYKVDKARTRAYGGSGIGLSIVRAIMDAHHQTCGVCNREDGVEFWFTLEAARPEHQAENELAGNAEI
ncbi:MAG: HAMP domain-containing sensor histidine kinase [Lachnospiraceae bacterium]|nr:HAMP domain-containing sensor histidine kinase [Lachnospiraceae bacterium]